MAIKKSITMAQMPLHEKKNRHKTNLHIKGCIYQYLIVCACTFIEQSQMSAGSCTSVFINRKEERHSQTATATTKGMKSIWLDCKHFTSAHQQKNGALLRPTFTLNFKDQST